MHLVRPLALLLAALASLRAPGASLVLPGLANGSGRNGARFETELFVTNLSSAEAGVRFGLVPGGGAAPVAVERRLRANETLLLPNALQDLWGLEESYGTLTIDCASPLAVTGATRNVASTAGTYGVGLPPRAPLAPGTTGQAAWLSHTGSSGSGTRANLTVALLEAGTAATLEVRDASGALLGSRLLSSPVPTTWQGTVEELTAGRGVDPGSATLRVLAGHATGLVSVVDNATGDGVLSTFETRPSGETDLLVNGAASGPGALGTRWTTSLRLLNPGGTALLVAVDVVGVTPAPARWRIERTVPAGGVVALEDVLGMLGAPEGAAGAIRVHAAGPLLVAAATTTPDPAGGAGRFGVSQPVVRRRGGLAGPGNGVTLAGLSHGGSPSFRTNVALLADGTGASATLVLRAPDGAPIATAAATLASSEWRQKSLSDWFGVSGAAPGSRVDVTVDSGALDAVATVIDDGTGDAVAQRPVTLPSPCVGAVAGPGGTPGTTLTLGAAAGTIRPLLGVNIGPIPAGQATVDLTGAYREQGITSIRTHDYYGPLDMSTLYPNQNADPASPASYDFAASDAVFAKILAGSFEPYLRLGDSYSAGIGYPPAVPRRPTNPANWVKAAVEVVRHYDDAARWAGRPLRHVEIWNEPDNGRFWDGTHQEFFDLFVSAATALKAAFPHLSVGGPGFAPSGALAPQGQAMTRGLLAAIAASGAPLDFLSFHVYSNEPGVYREIVRFYRDELDTRGFGAVPLHITEWNTDTRSVPASEALALRAGGRGAAILSSVQVVLQEEGVVESYLYRGPDPSVTAPEFYGVFFADGRAKPAARALGLWKRLADGPERLALASSRASGPELFALAGRNEAGEETILVANPAATATSLRVVRSDGATVTCIRVDEVSDAAATTTSRLVEGDTVDVPGYSTLLLTLRS